MILKTLEIDAYHATDKPVEYICYGLGSCIALFVMDKLKGIAGGAHIASLGTSGVMEHAEDIIGRMLLLMRRYGSDLSCLRAKLTGGALTIPGLFAAGEANTKAVIQYLTKKRIFLAGQDTGGDFSRTARFNSVTGELGITTSNRDSYTI